MEPEGYRFQLFDRNFKGEGKDPAEVILQKMTSLDRYASSGDRFERVFRFPLQETELFEYIQAFKKKLAGALKVEPSTAPT